MKILFITPETFDKAEGYTKEDISFIGFPSLSAAVIGALTPSFAEFRAIDEAVEPLKTESAFREAAENADIIAISLNMTYKANRAIKIAQTFKNLGKTVVWGGVHVTSLYDHHRERFKKEIAPYADAVVLGEAEGEVWKDLVYDFYLFDGKLKKLYQAGLQLEDKGKEATRRKPESEIWPTPKYSAVNTAPFLVKHSRQATRGCPLDCEFCSVTSFNGPTFRKYDAKKVADDIRETLSGTSTFGLNKVEKAMSSFFAFVDDNIAFDRAYFGKLLEALAEVKRDFPSFSWGGQTTLYTIDKKIKYQGEERPAGELLEKSGCTAMFIGVESVSKESLKIANKDFNDVDKYPNQIKKFHDHGIMLNAGMVMGFDSDGESVFEDTFNFLIKNKIEISLLNILVPLPGTDLYRRYAKENRIFDYNWENYDGRHAVYYPTRMTPERLERGFLELWKELYSAGSIAKRILFNPDQVLRAVKQLPNFSKFEQIASRVYMNFRYAKISGRIRKARENAPKNRFGENLTFPKFKYLHSAGE